MPPIDRPLAGLRVLNFGWYWLLQVTSQVLADLGAEVFKIESPKRLDPQRDVSPYYNGIVEPDHCMWPHNTLRGCRSLAIDLKSPEGHAATLDLVAISDVVLENFTPGTMDSLGLGYHTLAARRPDLIMLSASAAGQNGPAAHLKTFGSVLTCLAGLDGLQGYPGEGPMCWGIAGADPHFGTLATVAVLAALRRRRLTGQGCHIDFSEWESMTCLLGAPLLDYQWNGRQTGPLGNLDAMMAPHGVYRAAGEDNWISLAVDSDAAWQALCRVAERDDWARDRRFADGYRRLRARAELDRQIEEWTQTQEALPLAKRLQAAGVMAFPAYSPAQLFADPHYNARGNAVLHQHWLGPEVIYGPQVKLSETPLTVRRPFPPLGGDNAYTLYELLGWPSESGARVAQG